MSNTNLVEKTFKKVIPSTIDQITVEKAEEGYVADVVFSRFNAKDELLITGRGLYSYKDVNGSWKMYAVEPIEG